MCPILSSAKIGHEVGHDSVAGVDVEVMVGSDLISESLFAISAVDFSVDEVHSTHWRHSRLRRSCSSHQASRANKSFVDCLRLRGAAGALG